MPEEEVTIPGNLIKAIKSLFEFKQEIGEIYDNNPSQFVVVTIQKRILDLTNADTDFIHQRDELVKQFDDSRNKFAVIMKDEPVTGKQE